MKPPKCVGTNKMWLLKKCVYGLKDGSRKWYIKLDKTLTKLGMKKVLLDEGMFTYKEKNILKGILCLHVDALIYSGDDEFGKKIRDYLREEFLISSEEETSSI